MGKPFFFGQILAMFVGDKTRSMVCLHQEAQECGWEGEAEIDHPIPFLMEERLHLVLQYLQSAEDICGPASLGQIRDPLFIQDEDLIDLCFPFENCFPYGRCEHMDSALWKDFL